MQQGSKNKVLVNMQLSPQRIEPCMCLVLSCSSLCSCPSLVRAVCNDEKMREERQTQERDRERGRKIQGLRDESTTTMERPQRPADASNEIAINEDCYSLSQGKHNAGEALLSTMATPYRLRDRSGFWILHFPGQTKLYAWISNLKRDV